MTTQLTTQNKLHKFIFPIDSTELWYSIIADCNNSFGINNWKTKKKMRKRIQAVESGRIRSSTPHTWFAVPDETFGTFLIIKYGLEHIEHRVM